MSIWLVRVVEDHPSTSSDVSLDSQTAPTAVIFHQDVDYGSGKQIKDRKRFTLVDMLRLFIAVQVVAANVLERQGNIIYF